MKPLKLRKRTPIPVPHNSPLWQDWNALLKEYFTENPNSQVAYVPDAQSLVCDLVARFNGWYDVFEIQKQLDTSYNKVENKGYEFLRSDFIKEVAS